MFQPGHSHCLTYLSFITQNNQAPQNSPCRLRTQKKSRSSLHTSAGYSLTGPLIQSPPPDPPYEDVTKTSTLVTGIAAVRCFEAGKTKERLWRLYIRTLHQIVDEPVKNIARA